MGTGEIYSSKETALKDGVSSENLRRLKEGEIFTVKSGPFKGRIYKYTAHGIERIKEKV